MSGPAAESEGNAPAGCSIRPFAARDLSRLHDIRDAAYRPIFAAFRSLVGEAIADVAIAAAEREQAAYLDRICGPGGDRDVYVVECGGAVIGFYSLALDRATKIGEIDLNAVDPDHQGGGVGTFMYRDALARMTAAGMKVANVATGADESHAPARRAYEKAGFGPVLPCVYLYKKL